MHYSNIQGLHNLIFCIIILVKYYKKSFIIPFCKCRQFWEISQKYFVTSGTQIKQYFYEL